MLIAEHSMCQPGRPDPIVGLPAGLARLGPLPEAKSRTSSFDVLVGRDPLPYPHARRDPGGPGARSWARRRSGRRWSRPRSGRRGLAPGASRSSVDHLRDVRGRPGQHVRHRHPERRRVGQEPRGVARRERVDPDRLGRRAADDLVVDVREVHHPGDPQAAPAQVADEQVGEQERPEVADVGRPVDRRSAAVDADVAGLERLERLRAAAVSVSCSRTLICPPRPIGTADRRGAEMPRPAPSSPARLPVDALTFDPVGRQRQEVGDRVAHRRRAEPARWGRAPMIVTSTDSGRIPRCVDPAERTPRRARRRRSRAAWPGPAGRCARDRPARPRRAARRRPRGARRRRPSGRAAAGAASIVTPPERERLARPERVARRRRARPGRWVRRPPDPPSVARAPGRPPPVRDRRAASP